MDAAARRVLRDADDQYGPRFMEEIAKHPLPALLDNDLSDTLKSTP